MPGISAGEDDRWKPYWSFYFPVTIRILLPSSHLCVALVVKGLILLPKQTVVLVTLGNIMFSIFLILSFSYHRATTHSDLVLRAVKLGIPYKVIHNASIMNAVGCCGLQVILWCMHICYFTTAKLRIGELFYCCAVHVAVSTLKICTNCTLNVRIF